MDEEESDIERLRLGEKKCAVGSNEFIRKETQAFSNFPQDMEDMTKNQQVTLSDTLCCVCVQFGDFHVNPR